MSGKKIKKLPIVSYLCALLALAVLLTGVTFSRYVSTSDGGATVGVTPFACSFSIDDISSTSFSSSGYWSNGTGGTALNTVRTVTFSVQNYDAAATSGVDLQSTFRITSSKSFLDSIAFQIADGTGTRALTPQYVLGNLIYEVEETTDTTEGSDTAGASFYGYSNGEKTYRTAETTTLDPSLFIQYGSLDYAVEVSDMLTVTGRFSDGNKIVALSAWGVRIEITRTIQENAAYSVAFGRGEVLEASTQTGGAVVDMSAPVFYLDCEDEVELYTLDITIPDMLLEAKEGQVSKEFVFRFTTAEKIDDDDYQQPFPADIDLLSPQNTGAFRGAKVTGYHFDTKSVPYAWKKGENEGRATATVRTYAKYGGEQIEYSYYMVTDTAAYALEEREVGYVCEVDGVTYTFAVSDFEQFRNPYNSLTQEKAYLMSKSYGKGFPISARVLFVQVSQEPQA